MRQQLRLALSDLRELALEGFGDTSVLRAAARAAACHKPRVLNEGVLEHTEVQGAIRRRFKAATPGLGTLVSDIERSRFAFPQSGMDVVAAALNKTCAGYPDLFRDLFKYLSNIEDRGAKPNREAQLVGRFARTHAAAQADLQKSGVSVKEGRISCVFPPGGIQDNTVNRSFDVEL